MATMLDFWTEADDPTRSASCPSREQVTVDGNEQERTVVGRCGRSMRLAGNEWTTVERTEAPEKGPRF